MPSMSDTFREMKADEIQKRILLSELLKLLATLSIAAIALMAGFLRSLVELGEHENVLLFATGGFSICLLFSVAAYWIIVKDIENDKLVIFSPEQWYKPVKLGSLLSLASFFLGVYSLSLFIFLTVLTS